MTPASRALRTGLPILGLLIGLVAGCWRGQADVPAGATQVHVVVTATDVRLDPATVPAGDVYVVLETPRSSVGFVRRADGKSLTDAELARLATGDEEAFAIGGFSLAGCSDEQRAQDLGKQGYCGNVFKEVLGPGRYAFLGSGHPGLRPVAVLSVVDPAAASNASR
jgi:hypothetical protein